MRNGGDKLLWSLLTQEVEGKEQRIRERGTREDKAGPRRVRGERGVKDGIKEEEKGGRRTREGVKKLGEC